MTDEPTTPAETRSIDLQVEVDAPPEKVWEAIATGPGISAWFVPAEVDTHEGGKVTLHFGSMGDETAEITTWQPSERVVMAWDQWADSGGHALELLVEARDGGSCVVRLIHSGFGTGAEFDAEFHQTSGGWAAFLNNLRLYLERWAPQVASWVFVHGGSDGAQAAAWAGLTDGLGLPASELVVGRRVATSDEAVASGAPRLAGVVDRNVGGLVTLVVDEPATGVVTIGAEGADGGVFMSVTAHLFGEGAAEAAEQAAPKWEKWMADHFPHPEAPEGSEEPAG